MCVLSEDLDRVLEPGHDEIGWLGQTGRVPLGYLGDADKTARTFPAIDGVRYSVPGRPGPACTADGTLELYGRDSVTINSGGEKIFAEEVEQALLRHPAVADCVVTGRPSHALGHRGGGRRAADAGAEATDDDLLEEAARHMARYKLPKAIVRDRQIHRSPSGKADYRWAHELAVGRARSATRARSAHRGERGADLVDERRRLLERREVPTDAAGVGEVAQVGAPGLGPAPRRPEDLLRVDADARTARSPVAASRSWKLSQ